MKCKYRFKAFGHLRIRHLAPITTDTGVFDFTIDATGRITGVDVTVQLAEGEWTEPPRERPQNSLPAPLFGQLDDVRESLRVLQGILAFFGDIRFETWNVSAVWIPETQHEASSLAYREFEIDTRNREASPPLDFSLFAQSVMATTSARAHQLPLSFFHRGVEDIDRCDYVDAIYDFYFILETLHANGKFKKQQVVSEFKASRELMEDFRLALEAPPPPDLQRGLAGAYLSRFGQMNPEDLAEHFVDVRGRLHHHSMTDSRGVWDPEEQEHYRLDALMLHIAAFRVISRILMPLLYDPSVLRAYDALRETGAWLVLARGRGLVRTEPPDQ